MKTNFWINTLSQLLFTLGLLLMLLIFSEDARTLGSWIAVRVMLAAAAAICFCGHRVLEAFKTANNKTYGNQN